MSIYSRLTEVFLEARQHPIPFDDHARFIFFSDCHRGDGSWADEFARNQDLYTYALEYYFERGYTYFELGDGDELFNFRRFTDIQQAHNHIFELIKRFHDARPSRFYMLYGNHDLERADPRIVSETLGNEYHDRRSGRDLPLFKGIRVLEGLVLKHTPSGGELFLVHGHQGDLFNERLWKLSRFLSRTFWEPLELLGITEPTDPAKSLYKRGKVEKKLMDWVGKQNQPTICGHTHRPRFAREGRIPYFNSGCCIFPRHITGIEIQAGKIILIQWWLSPDRTGRLRVTREELERPRTVASIFQP